MPERRRWLPKRPDCRAVFGKCTTSSTGNKAPNVRELFESYAGTIGLDLDKFKKDIDGEQAQARVEADRQRGESLGIQLTPTLFINNQPLDPKDKNPEGIRAEINAALGKKTQT